MAGRRPKATWLKKLQGVPGKRKLNDKEPKLKSSIPKMPAGLSTAAKKQWGAISKQLHDAKIITELDAHALSMFCEASAKWVTANKAIQKHGFIIKTSSGYPVQSPYIGIANKAFDQMYKMMVEFGLSPSSRTKVQVIPDDPERESPIDKYRNRRR